MSRSGQWNKEPACSPIHTTQVSKSTAERKTHPQTDWTGTCWSYRALESCLAAHIPTIFLCSALKPRLLSGLPVPMIKSTDHPKMSSAFWYTLFISPGPCISYHLVYLSRLWILFLFLSVHVLHSSSCQSTSATDLETQETCTFADCWNIQTIYKLVAAGLHFQSSTGTEEMN